MVIYKHVLYMYVGGIILMDVFMQGSLKYPDILMKN